MIGMVRHAVQREPFWHVLSLLTGKIGKSEQVDRIFMENSASFNGVEMISLRSGTGNNFSQNRTMINAVSALGVLHGRLNN
jgi:hypothetical protein